MNLKYRDNDLIVFLNQNEIEKINFKNKIELQKYFRNLFIKIKEIYKIYFKGSYDITIYIDKKIGTILEIKNEETEYFEYDDDIIDMKIKEINDEFIFKIENNIKLKNKPNIYLYKNNIYLKPNKISKIEQGILLENSKLIYGEERKKIMNDLNLIKLDKI